MQEHFEIIYYDQYIIAVNKAAGIAVQDDKTGDPSLAKLITCSLEEQGEKSAVSVIHRIDRPTTGVVLFALTPAAAAAFSKLFAEKKIRKVYHAVVDRLPPHETGSMTHFIKKDGRCNKSAIETRDDPDALPSVLQYTHMCSSEHYHLLGIILETGRHHQIRAQLGAEGIHIKGDCKYGAKRGNKDRSIHLHAYSVSFVHPFSGISVTIKAEYPLSDPLWHYFADQCNILPGNPDSKQSEEDT